MNLFDLWDEFIAQRSMLDIRLSQLYADSRSIKFSQRLGPFTIVLSLVLFTLCVYFLWSLFTHFNWFLFIIVIGACPALLICALFLIFAKNEVFFDLLNKKITRSCSLFHFKNEEFALFPQHGAIKLSTRRESSKMSSRHAYYVKVHPYNYSWFFSIRDYDLALAFSRKLSELLSFPLEDTVQPKI